MGRSRKAGPAGGHVGDSDVGGVPSGGTDRVAGLDQNGGEKAPRAVREAAGRLLLFRTYL